MKLEDIKSCLMGVNFVFDARTIKSIEEALKEQLGADEVKVTARKRQRMVRGFKYDMVNVDIIADGEELHFIAGINKGSYMFNDPQYSRIIYLARV